MPQKYQFIAILTADRDMLPGTFSVGDDWLKIAFGNFLSQRHYNTEVVVLRASLLDNEGNLQTSVARKEDDTNEMLVSRLDMRDAVQSGQWRDRAQGESDSIPVLASELMKQSELHILSTELGPIQIPIKEYERLKKRRARTVEVTQ